MSAMKPTIILLLLLYSCIVSLLLFKVVCYSNSIRILSCVHGSHLEMC